ncbi:MAG: hypothetical protein HOH74_07160 [Gemmatimonadetes bacterium]|nr:hypothetical protein [Gemmatimonadota bacterium]
MQALAAADDRGLADDRVERILTEGRTASRRSWRPVWMTGVAAMLLLGLGGLHLQRQESSLRHAVLVEIAMNHDKDLQAEITTTSYADVVTALDRVDFAIAPASQIPDAALTGARYCSIQGQLAALLKLRIDARRHTLYVTRATDWLTSLAPYEATHDGVDIHLWTEADRFYALAVDNAE